MDNIAGTKSSLTWAVHISVAALVALWLFPTVGLFVSSFRTADQISASGWWKSLFPTEQVIQVRTGARDAAVKEGDRVVLTFNAANGNLITIGDVDVDETAAPNNTLQVTLSVNDGILTLSQTAGLTFEGGTANGESMIVVTGTSNARSRIVTS